MVAWSLSIHLLFLGLTFLTLPTRSVIVHSVDLVSPAFVAPAPARRSESRVVKSRPAPSADVPAAPSRPAPALSRPAVDDDPDALREWWKKRVKAHNKPIVVPPVSRKTAKTVPQNVPSTRNDATPVATPIGVPVPSTTAQEQSAPEPGVQNAILSTGEASLERAMTLHSAYFNRVRNKIDHRWVAVGLPGGRAVTLVFNLRRDGNVDSVRVDESSGDRLFDLAAQRAVQEAAPLPPFPAGMTDRVHRIRYRFVADTGDVP